jgi:hypothetical protein
VPKKEDPGEENSNLTETNQCTYITVSGRRKLQQELDHQGGRSFGIVSTFTEKLILAKP